MLEIRLGVMAVMSFEQRVVVRGLPDAMGCQSDTCQMPMPEFLAAKYFVLCILFFDEIKINLNLLRNNVIFIHIDLWLSIIFLTRINCISHHFYFFTCENVKFKQSLWQVKPLTLVEIYCNKGHR